jgi:hypothetical protein
VDWYGEHPATWLLKKGYEVKSSRYERYFNDPDRMGMFNVEWLRDRLPGKSIVYGITLGPFATAVTESKMDSVPLLTITLGYDPVVIFKGGDGGVRAYIARADSIILELEYAGKDRVIRDGQTGSVWNLIDGVSTAGNLKGTTLDEVKVLPVFWFAWSNFYPRTDVID